jgi:hypothetical protein
MQKNNFQKTAKLFLSTTCGAATIYLLLPRGELGNHSIIRSFVAPPKLSKYDDVDWNFEKYLRLMYGPNWEDKTSIPIRRQELFSLVANDFGILNLSLGLFCAVFFGSVIAFLVYKFEFKKPKNIS